MCVSPISGLSSAAFIVATHVYRVSGQEKIFLLACHIVYTMNAL